MNHYLKSFFPGEKNHVTITVSFPTINTSFSYIQLYFRELRYCHLNITGFLINFLLSFKSDVLLHRDSDKFSTTTARILGNYFIGNNLAVRIPESIVK